MGNVHLYWVFQCFIIKSYYKQKHNISGNNKGFQFFMKLLWDFVIKLFKFQDKATLKSAESPQMIYRYCISIKLQVKNITSIIQHKISISWITSHFLRETSVPNLYKITCTGQSTKSLGILFQLLNTWNSLNPVWDKKYGILIITVYFQVVLWEIQVIDNFMVFQIKALVFSDDKEFPTDGILSKQSLKFKK